MNIIYNSVEKIEKTAESDAKTVVLDLVRRVKAKCGNIVSCERLRISENGTLNGSIEGDKDNAIVETIGAGGYNVQCFHFRTLVK